MKIMVIADREDPGLWDYYSPNKTEGVDLILSCGDLAPEYLEFLVTVANCPLLFVRGNHDQKYDIKYPDGCIDIDDKIYNYKGLRILGLGGSRRYRPGSDMYTEKEMRKRIRKLKSKLWLTNGFDILLTHAPARGYGDLEDLPHQGFDCFNTLMEKYHPKYMFYGHVHQEYGDFQREYNHSCGTKLINGYSRYILDVDENIYPEEGKTGNRLYDRYISWKKRR